MGISTPQKVKLLKLMELLRENSDGEHPLKTNELCAMLGEAGISCDRRTLSKDIAVLNDCGYEILSTMQGHDKAYYIADRSFSLAELKILIDAVQAASFISESKTKDLIDKIAALGNNHRAELLREVWYASIPESTAMSKSITLWNPWKKLCGSIKRCRLFTLI